MNALLSTFGVSVQERAHEIPPNMTAVAMLRTCEPTPALVKLLADTAAAWARAGRLDDAAAALALGLCAHSAVRARETPTLDTLRHMESNDER